jgi:ribosomal protein L1
MRGRVYFPHNPSTQESRIYVICGFQDEKAALDAGAALAGGKELVDKVRSPLLLPHDFKVVSAGRHGRGAKS